MGDSVGERVGDFVGGIDGDTVGGSDGALTAAGGSEGGLLFSFWSSPFSEEGCC